MDIEVKVKITDKNFRCVACSTMVDESNYYLLVIYGANTYKIHDNDGVCLAKLMVKLHLAQDNFLSTRPVYEWRLR